MDCKSQSRYFCWPVRSLKDGPVHVSVFLHVSMCPSIGPPASLYLYLQSIVKPYLAASLGPRFTIVAHWLETPYPVNAPCTWHCIVRSTKCLSYMTQQEQLCKRSDLQETTMASLNITMPSGLIPVVRMSINKKLMPLCLEAD